VIIYLGRRLPGASCDLTRELGRAAPVFPYSVLLLAGFT